MKKKFVIVYVSLASVIGAGVFFLWRSSQNPVKAGAVRLGECFKAHNTDCVFEYLAQDDIDTYSLTKNKIRDLFRMSDNYVKLSNGSLEVQPFNSETMYAVIIPGVTVKGKASPYSFVVSNTKEGIKSPKLITAWLLTLASSKFVAGKQSGAIKLTGWALFAREEGAQMSNIGFNGIYREQTEGFFSWGEWAAFCDSRLEKLNGRQ